MTILMNPEAEEDNHRPRSPRPKTAQQRQGQASPPGRPRTRDNVRTLPQGLQLWTTSDYTNTARLREEVLGWKINTNDLDYDANTVHVVMTADKVSSEPKAYGIDKVIQDNSFNYVFNTPTEETAAKYVGQGHADVVAIVSIGYQDYPVLRDLSGFMRARAASRTLNTARFYAVAVDPRHQHKGLGLRVMNEAMYWCRNQSIELLWANARESALSFYTDRLFFDAVGEMFLDVNTEMMDKRIVQWVA